jgi:ATP-dependent DNA helicase PIF1
MTLSTEQSAALATVAAGKNIFLTGAGGTGKSHVIRAIAEWATAAGIRFAITAMTGCAALILSQAGLMRPRTLHSWAGVGLARETPHELAATIQKNRAAKRRWLDTQLLVIDEISMCTPEFLEKLDLIGRRVRNTNRPFGGIQLVLAGDFCQLPPVVRGEDTTRFVFEMPLWTTLVQETHYLTKLQRQTDPVFQKILTEARLGRLSEESQNALESRMGLPWQTNEIRPTLLFTRNAEVDRVNRANMEALEGERRVFTAETATLASEQDRRLISPSDPAVVAALERLDTDAPYEKILELCVGAQVMLLVNISPEKTIDDGPPLVNGSRGVIVGYTAATGLPIVKFCDRRMPVPIDRAIWWLPDYDGIGRSQIPLRVAYALTIHKSQGATLDSALVDIGASTFEFGQAYVALSRVRSLEGLYVWKLDPRKIRCHPAVVRFYESLAPTPVENPTEGGSDDGLKPEGDMKPEGDPV